MAKFPILKSAIGAVAIAAMFCASLNAQIYNSQPVQGQPIYNGPIVQQPVNQFPQGQIIYNSQPVQRGVIVPPAVDGTVIPLGTKGAWDSSQGYDNDDVILKIVEPPLNGNVRFRYPKSAEAPLKYAINGGEGELPVGQNLSIPAGDDFKFSFMPKDGAEAVAVNTTEEGDFVFVSTDAGWKIEKYQPPTPEEAAAKMKAMQEAEGTVETNPAAAAPAKKEPKPADNTETSNKPETSEKPADAVKDAADAAKEAASPAKESLKKAADKSDQ